MQLYTSNYVWGQTCKGGQVYRKHSAVCLETQHVPDSPNHPNFPSVDRPAYPVVLRIFRQIDPTGTKIPSDEMAEVARSAAGRAITRREGLPRPRWCSGATWFDRRMSRKVDTGFPTRTCANVRNRRASAADL